MVVYDTPGPSWPNLQDIGHPWGFPPSLAHGDAEVGFGLEQVVQQSAIGLYAIPGYKMLVGHINSKYLNNT